MSAPGTWRAAGRALNALAALALAACNSSPGTETRAPQSAPLQNAESDRPDRLQPTPPENTMQQDALLEDGVILLFEKVSLGNEPEANRRWKVSEDGTVWFSKNRTPVPPDQEFNQDFERLASLSAEQRQALLETARKAGFWTAPETIQDDAVEDGMRLRLTIRDQGQVKRIMADNARSEVIEAITAAFFAQIGTPRTSPAP
jgi:hypothetical protein